MVMSATADIPTSVWPAPTLSTMTGSNPAYSSTLAIPRTDLATAPAAPLEAMLRMYVPESVDPDMRTRSPSMAPPVTWLVGSTARTAGLVPSWRRSTETRSMSVLFPAPAGPVIPITVALPVCANISATISLAPPWSFSTIEMALAMSPRLPLLRPASNDALMAPRGAVAIKPMRGRGGSPRREPRRRGTTAWRRDLLAQSPGQFLPAAGTLWRFGQHGPPADRRLLPLPTGRQRRACRTPWRARRRFAAGCLVRVRRM